MKTLVLSTLIALATAGISNAYQFNQLDYPVTSKATSTETDKKKEAFQAELDFHQWKMEVLWNQYDLSVAAIHNKRGGRADLERDKAFFMGIYQENINKSIYMERNKSDMDKVERSYDKQLAKNEEVDKQKITRLQALLKKELLLEEKRFEKVKLLNRAIINGEISLKLESLEQYFAQSMQGLKP